jgi:hypothetical protein
MHRDLLDEQGPHPAFFEVPMVHPAIRSGNLVRVLGVADEFALTWSLDLKE